MEVLEQRDEELTHRMAALKFQRGLPLGRAHKQPTTSTFHSRGFRRSKSTTFLELRLPSRRDTRRDAVEQRKENRDAVLSKHRSTDAAAGIALYDRPSSTGFNSQMQLVPQDVAVAVVAVAGDNPQATSEHVRETALV